MPPREPPPWGFVVFRTAYGDDETWEKVRAKISEEANGALGDEFALSYPDFKPEKATLVFIDDKNQLGDKSTGEIRKIMNPTFVDGTKDAVIGDRDPELPLEGFPDELKPHLTAGQIIPQVCLVVDKDSLASIANFIDSPLLDNSAYVVAVDSHVGPENGEGWDGTFKLGLYAILVEFYPDIAENNLIMEEIGPRDGSIYHGP